MCQSTIEGSNRNMFHATGQYFVLLLLPWSCLAVLKCELQTGRQASNFGISSEARDAIDFTTTNREGTGQSASSFQALDCWCDPHRDRVRIDSQTTGDLDDDSNLFSTSNDRNWRAAAVLRIRDCHELELDLGTNIGDLPREMEGGVFIVDNVNELIIDDFSAGNSGGGDKRSLNTFTSMYFRNVEFVDLFPTGETLVFRDKADLTFYNISMVKSSTLNRVKLNIQNSYSGHNPIVRVEESRFPGASNPADGISTSESTFELEVRNQQLEKDSSGGNKCNLDYKGTIMVKNNVFGVLPSNAIQIIGGERLEMAMNEIGMLTADSIYAKNIANTLIRRNFFKTAFDLPTVVVEYQEKTGSLSCSTNDMNEADVKLLSLSKNHFVNTLSQTPYEINHDFDNVNFVKDNLMADDTAVMSKCDCDIEFPDNPNDDEIAFEMVVSKSNCTWTVDNEMVMGSRTEICKGNFPLTNAEKEQKLRDEIKKDWTIFLVVAVIVTFILTVILTALIMWFCCNSNRGEVTPRE